MLQVNNSFSSNSKDFCIVFIHIKLVRRHPSFEIGYTLSTHRIEDRQSSKSNNLYTCVSSAYNMRYVMFKNNTSERFCIMNKKNGS